MDKVTYTTDYINTEKEVFDACLFLCEAAIQKTLKVPGMSSQIEYGYAVYCCAIDLRL